MESKANVNRSKVTTLVSSRGIINNETVLN